MKSILDIGRTLEFLETQGVCVATFGKTTEFPAFFSARSGFHSACNIESVDEAAQLINTTFKLNLSNGECINYCYCSAMIVIFSSFTFCWFHRDTDSQSYSRRI